MEFLENNLPPKRISLYSLDEVGRGPIAGPVISCCVKFEGTKKQLCAILNELKDLNLTDSKKLTSKKRIKILDSLGIDLRKVNVREKCEFSYRKKKFQFMLWDCDHNYIDRENILKSSLDSMAKAAIGLKVCEKDRVWIDGNKAPQELKTFPLCETFIKGDSRSGMIALSSIIAKEWRDLFMTDMAKKYPHYGFEKHSGYPTIAHKAAVKEYGPCPIHRRTFRGVKEYVGKSEKV